VLTDHSLSEIDFCFSYRSSWWIIVQSHCWSSNTCALRSVTKSLTSGVPTDAYGPEEAVGEGKFLVPPKGTL